MSVDDDLLVKRLIGSSLDELHSAYLASRQYDDWLNCLRFLALKHSMGEQQKIGHIVHILGQPDEHVECEYGRAVVYLHARFGAGSDQNLVSQVSFDIDDRVVAYSGNERKYFDDAKRRAFEAE